MQSYVTINHRSKCEYEDRRSIFIAEAMPVKDEAGAIRFIESVKKTYPDARHHVYAYSLRENSIMRFSDDGEPQGTAGIPILDIIRKKGLTDIVVVVTRYFGGTLLGTGGLVRAYSSSAISAIEEAEIITYDLYNEISFSATYSDYQRILPVLSEFQFRDEDTIFLENVELHGRIANKDLQAFQAKLTEITSGRSNIEVLSEIFDFAKSY